MNDLSPADISALTNNEGFGGNGAWWIILFLIFAFMGGGNGLFGNRNASGGVADNYVLTSDFANIERKMDGLSNGLCEGFYTQAQLVNNTNMNLANGFASAELSRANNATNVLQSINSLGTQMQNCCCTNRYDALQNSNAVQSAICSSTRELIDNQNANARQILDALNAQAIAQKDAKIAEQNQTIFGLQLSASQQAQNNYLLGQLKQIPVPAYTVPNPYSGCNC